MENKKQKIINILSEFHVTTDLFNRLSCQYSILYSKLYNNICNNYMVYYDEDKQDFVYKVEYELNEDDMKYQYYIDMSYLISNCYNDVRMIVMSDNFNHGSKIFIGIDNDFIFNKKDTLSYYINLHSTPNEIDKVFNLIKPYLRLESLKKEAKKYGLCCYSQHIGMQTRWYNFNKEINLNLEEYYNDDFKGVYEKMVRLLQDNSSSELILLYGEPGTGKSTLIKSFIGNDIISNDIVLLDNNLITSITQQDIINYILDNKETIFVLEDCERLLMSRDISNNPIINTILNLTDGILGDTLKVKLICTFNTNLNNIDKALLRKGRLSLKYEFKKLNKEKCSKVLGYEVKEDMTLADVIYANEENDYSKNGRKRVGF